MKKWQTFPYPDDRFDYNRSALQKAWKALHSSDLVPWPTGKHDDACIQAWQHFHAGRFQQAYEVAAKVAPYAFAAQCKAMITYADHLEDHENRQQALYEEAASIAEQACEKFPELAAAHYFHAYALGRYGQSISVVKALRQGLGGKVAESLEKALELAPDYPDAHLAMGLYHAEIIDKVGKMVARMTYGCTRDKAMHHLQQALQLNPRPPVTQIEYGNGIIMLFGDEQLELANDCYRQAAASEPLDAMEKLDQTFAEAEVAAL